jgi:D-beta-D-heptose 7-phosphate kinase/D-beta-D-heptose 1-phosphate adenosyltransferase
MTAEMPGLVDGLAGRQVLVLGEAILDTYLEGTVRRFCPEGPVPVLDVVVSRDLAGGAANTAANSRALGGEVSILHRGHVTLLGQARALGDLLIVAVNSDEGVRRLKGPGRPVNPLADRAGVLSALGCVDHVVAFGEDTPCAVIVSIGYS